MVKSLKYVSSVSESETSSPWKVKNGGDDDDHDVRWGAGKWKNSARNSGMHECPDPPRGWGGRSVGCIYW